MTARTDRTRLRGVFAAIALAASLAAQAEAIVVRCVDPAGNGIEGVSVYASLDFAIDADGTRIDQSSRRRHGYTTGEDGFVRFERRPAGRYTITTWGKRAGGWLGPEALPGGEPVQVVHDGEAESVVTIPMVRATPVVLRMDLDPSADLKGHVRAVELDRGGDLSVALEPGTDREIALPPGRWRLEWRTPPRGYLMRDLELDGVPVPGANVELRTLDRDPRTRFVRWSFAAPAVVEGSVARRPRDLVVSVVARNVEPGDWGDDPERIRASTVREVRTGVDPIDGTYEMPLPDGRWRIEVTGPSVTTVEPPSVTLRLAPGDVRRLDFTADGDESDASGRSLWVDVVRPGARPREPNGVSWIEVRPVDAERGEPPTQSGETHAFGAAYFRGLAPGEYRVTAVHPEWLEGESRVTIEDDEKKDGARVTVRLGEPVRVRALFLDDADAPVAGGQLRAERLDEPPSMWTTTPPWNATGLAASGTTDVGGRVWLEGLHPGRYRLTGRVIPGERRAAGTLRFRNGEPSYEVVLSGDRAPREIVVRVEEAATVHGALECFDGRPLPTTVDLRAWPETHDLGAGPARAWDDAAEAAFDGEPLDEDGGFRIGPLPEGRYRLAWKPEGFDRWTFFPGVEQPDGAEVVTLSPGRLPLEAVSVDCGPAVRVRLRPGAGMTLPDLRAGRDRRRRATVTGTIDDRRIRSPRIDLFVDEILVREIDAGVAVIEVAVTHPWFLPENTVRATIDATLHAPGTIDVDLAVPVVGGSIAMPDVGSLAVLAGDPLEEPRLGTPDGRGTIRFESVPPGRYRISFCTDETCRTLAEWLEIDLESAQALDLTGS